MSKKRSPGASQQTPEKSREWDVRENRVASDGKEDLPKAAKEDYQTLVRTMKAQGPSRGGAGRHNFSPLRQLRKKYGGRKVFHCHLNKGKSTYVVIWVEYDKPKRQILVVYVGTHEGAPY